MKAVVLAAGEGSRLRPLTLSRPKHMVPIAGKPLLEYTLSTLKKNGIDEILVIVGHYKDLVKNYFLDGGDWGVNLTYMEQRGLHGTADAISYAEEYVDNENFLVLYGDLLIEPSVVKTIIGGFEEKGLPTIAVVPVKEPSRFGIVITEKGSVKKIVEKPQTQTFGNLANAGIYIFSRGIFNRIRDTVQSLRGEFEITDTLQLLIKKKEQISFVEIDPDNWLDVGRPWDLLEANKRILQHTLLENRGRMEKGVQLKGPVGTGDGVKMLTGTFIEGPVFIDEGSEIGPNCYIRPFTSLGKHVRIGNGCEVKNSIILDRTHIGHLSYVGDSIIGARCNFGAGTIAANLRFDEKTIKVKVKDKMMDSKLKKLGTIMGDDVKTGIGVRLMPGVKVGMGAWIGPSVTVFKDIPSHAFVMHKPDLMFKEKP